MAGCKNTEMNPENNMSVQIFGTKKCKDTQKAERFFKERNIPVQFRDLTQKGICPGELNNIKQFYDVEELLDREGKQFKKRNLEYMVFNVEEELLEDPLLFKTPIIRYNRKAIVGYQPDVWKEWVDKIK
jgi:arsenate reductase (glutaredoxin)